MAKVQILITEEIGPQWYADWGVPCFSVESLKTALDAISDKDEIEVLINSPGGVVDEGLSIFTMLIEVGKKQTVITRCIGQAASISALIFLSGTERIMMPGTKAMIHQASSGEWGKAGDLRKKADELEAESNNIFDLMIARSDKLKENENKLREYFDAEKYIYADECVQLGIAHKVEELPKAYNFSPNKMFSTMFKNSKFDAVMKKIDDFLSGKKMASIQTDGDNATTIYYDGELKEGTAVFSDEAMTTALADGEYIVGGRTYTCKDGKVTSISAAPESDEAKASREAAEAATASANAEKEIMKNLSSFADGTYNINGKDYVVKDKQVQMKIDTNVVDVEKSPAFIQMKKDMDLMKTNLNDNKVQNERLKQENAHMKSIVAEIKTIGFGEGLGDDDKKAPAGYEMKDGKLVKKAADKMSRKERLLMVAETMDRQRETGERN